MKTLRARLVVALVLGALLTGCGQGSPESSRIQFGSPAVGANGVISPRYRCGAGTIWLPLRWGSVPEDARELVLYLGRFEAKSGGGKGKGFEVPFGVFMTGIKPSLRSIEANTFPPGLVPLAFHTSNSCPSQGKRRNLLVELFALDQPGQVAPQSLGASFVTRLTEDALGVPEPAAKSALAEKLIENAQAVGVFTATYGSRAPDVNSGIQGR